MTDHSPLGEPTPAVYVAVCECGAILSGDRVASPEFPVERLSCRECGVQVPAHLLTLPYRGYGIDQVVRCAVCGGDVQQTQAATLTEAVPGGTNYWPAHPECVEQT